MPAHYIVTPVRNASRTIDATIWSIISQGGGIDIHYHVQDGGSTDGTRQIIEKWADKLEILGPSLPSRIHFSYASEPDTGMYDAIGRAFSRLSPPADAFMNWCNADDALWPNALEAVTRISTQLPEVDWIMGWPSWFDDFGRFVAIERSPRYPQAVIAAGLADGIHWPFVQQESTFWRKRLWDRVGGLDASLRLAGDWDLWRRFAKVAPLTHVHRQLGAFYVRPNQQSADMKRYRSEMDSVIPLKRRQQKLRIAKEEGAPLASLPWAYEGADHRWQLGTRRCSRRAAWAARLLPRAPLAQTTLYRSFEKLW